MAKGTKSHFVLIEDSKFSDYPTLIPLRDYLNEHNNPPNDITIEKELLNNGFTKLVSENNIIFVQNALNKEENENK